MTTASTEPLPLPSIAQLEAVVVTLAAPLGLKIEAEWLAGVALQFQISLKMAQLLDTVPLTDETEAAPVYRL